MKNKVLLISIDGMRPDGLQACGNVLTECSDVNGDGKLSTADCGRLNAFLLGKVTLAW